MDKTQMIIFFVSLTAFFIMFWEYLIIKDNIYEKKQFKKCLFSVLTDHPETMITVDRLCGNVYYSVGNITVGKLKRYSPEKKKMTYKFSDDEYMSLCQGRLNTFADIIKFNESEIGKLTNEIENKIKMTW